jgi:uncharacterized protein (UPF0335 family)
MTSIGGIAADQIKLFIERIDHLEEENPSISVHTREVYVATKAVTLKS